MQAAAVKYIDGPLLVLAGAGSGKTRVITKKIAYLTDTCGYNPAHIAAITFTNKAAREMQERIGSNAKGGPLLSTFHSLGLRIVRSEAKTLGLKPQFSILDSADAFAILMELAKTTDKALIWKIASRISNWKNSFVSADEAIRDAIDDEAHHAARVFRDYQATLEAYQAVDFDDLIRLPVEIFEKNREVLAKWQDRIRYLLVDEYQDTNVCQYRLLRQIAGSRGAFTAVGDDDQAIYAWRGASVENIGNLQKDYPDLKVIKLEQNYRSTIRILKAANNLIAHNPKLFEKKLWSELGLGDHVRVVAAKDEEHEAGSVVMELLAHKFEHRRNFSDYAILYRGNHQARLFEQVLRKEKVPYKVSGGVSFFDRSEIKDIIGYLRLIVNPDDDPAFVRSVTTPKRGIGPQTLEALGSYAGMRQVSMFAAAFEAGFAQQVAARQLESLLEFCNYISGLQYRAAKETAAAILNDLIKAIGYEAYLYDGDEPKAAEAKWDNVKQFISWIEGRSEAEGETLLDLTQTIALITMLDKREKDLDEVQLSTLHAAKGLEFRHVFLVGAEEGILPHRESLTQEKIEEERRLMYVGVTRARETLRISFCLKRRRAKEMQSCEMSRFIEEMGKEDIRFSGMNHEPQVTKEMGRAKLAMLKSALGG